MLLWMQRSAAASTRVSRSRSAIASSGSSWLLLPPLRRCARQCVVSRCWCVCMQRDVLADDELSASVSLPLPLGSCCDMVVRIVCDCACVGVLACVCHATLTAGTWGQQQQRASMPSRTRGVTLRYTPTGRQHAACSRQQARRARRAVGRQTGRQTGRQRAAAAPPLCSSEA